MSLEDVVDKGTDLVRGEGGPGVPDSEYRMSTVSFPPGSDRRDYRGEGRVTRKRGRE